jgi:SPP1 gp7 family putative phage head morphogenesis protein
MRSVISSGQKDEAGAAFDALTETDINYIRAAVSETFNLNSYLKSARQSALNSVTHSISRITKSEQPLSTRVYRTESLANRWISNLINNSLARGDSAKDLAKKVRSSIIPTTPGGTSYAALRLGRTELNNAFHATSITMAQTRPWVTGMRWRVSDTHENDPTEICTQLAGRLFPVDQVPPKPHPQCRCYVASEIESLEVFKQNLTAGFYRDWISDVA